MNQDQEWNKKVVLVTGGGSGMGRDVCITLASKAASKRPYVSTANCTKASQSSAEAISVT